MSGPIPIVLLHHGQPDVLLQTIECIAANTLRAYCLFVVDNLSDPSAELTAALQRAEQQYGAVVIHNPRNNWIYGFNLALEHPQWPNAAFYAFSDADVLVPAPAGGKCWLTALEQEMLQHRCIGKLGLSLDLSSLAINPALRATYEAEKRLLSGETIGTNIIAPVDTTMALYRNDFFMGAFRFRIGHQSLNRPYYFTCRTAVSLSAIHVGWDFYPSASPKAHSIERQWRKALAMCRMGTWVAPELLRQFSAGRRLFLRLLQMNVRALHGVKLTSMVLWYVAKRLPRNLNEPQSRVR